MDVGHEALGEFACRGRTLAIRHVTAVFTVERNAADAIHPQTLASIFHLLNHL
jgi:hypothetical protein